ncbi:hypothetical protein ACFQY0_14770 [Haloferula chungangensis]|uniref:Uncharacterized protein n=1 Tax=Haloferula chungangensis TaxID=1048331 RepID=A0ABW2LA27_9BACT
MLGYGRYGDIRLVELVNDLYATTWLPLRDHFTPVMKLVEKTRSGSKVTKKYDEPRTLCWTAPTFQRESKVSCELNASASIHWSSLSRSRRNLR